jgi:hypothetical protein
VDSFGYGWFFSMTALLGLPVLVLVWFVSRQGLPENNAFATAHLPSE